MSTELQDRSLLLAYVYCLPGSCTCNFQEEFMSFDGLRLYINSLCYICGDFKIHVNLPLGDVIHLEHFLIHVI